MLLPRMNSNIFIRRINSRFISIFLLLAVIALMLLSCDPGRIFDDMKKIPGNEWRAAEPVTFSMTIDDTLELTNVFIQVRNTTQYPFSNLFLFITTLGPGGQPGRDTLECTLAAPDGKWTGSGRGLKENRFLLKQGMRWPRKGVYSFEIQQAMRTDPLPGIADVGLRVEKN